jgi:hypothetical protein
MASLVNNRQCLFRQIGGSNVPPQKVRIVRAKFCRRLRGTNRDKLLIIFSLDEGGTPANREFSEGREPCFERRPAFKTGPF